MIVFDQHPVYRAWAMERLPNVHCWPQGVTTLADVREGVIKGVVVYSDYTPTNVNMSIVIEGAHCMSRAGIRAVFRYPFLQLGVKRITGLIAESNARSRKNALNFGFIEEGRLRQFLPDEDVIVYGLLKADCKWL